MTEQLRALSDAATPGPWKASVGRFGAPMLASERPELMLYELRAGHWAGSPPVPAYAENAANAALIVAAVNDVRERLAAAPETPGVTAFKQSQDYYNAGYAAGQRAALPDEDGVEHWPGGGTRASRDPVNNDPAWYGDADGAWIVLYAPRQFYDGLRALRALRAAAALQGDADAPVGLSERVAASTGVAPHLLDPRPDLADAPVGGPHPENGASYWKALWETAMSTIDRLERAAAHPQDPPETRNG